jgi:hypothetical protein
LSATTAALCGIEVRSGRVHIQRKNLPGHKGTRVGLGHGGKAAKLRARIA